MKDGSPFSAAIAQIIHAIVPIKKKHWVFASDYGNLYREGSKYLFEYMNRLHPEFDCVYIVKNTKTLDEIKKKGFKAEMNSSIKGMLAIAKADAVFTTQWVNDLDYAFVKKGRRFYYLNHGQSLKKQMKALPDSYKQKIHKSTDKTLSQKEFLRKHLFLRLFCNAVYRLTGQPRSHTIDDVSFVSANSSFFLPFFRESYGDKMPVKILGMPRNDALFRHEEMKKERWLDGLDEKFIVTYMPTHRLYGIGELTPTPFINNPECLQWMRDNKVVLLMKQHPNMNQGVSDIRINDVIWDISNEGLDPQVVIYHSDVLISDYSSVWLDYLLLQRPLITYLYDDFENEDAGLNFDIRKDTPGHLCFTEDELFSLLIRSKEHYEEMKPQWSQTQRFYKDPDGNACRRYYMAISEEMGY